MFLLKKIRNYPLSSLLIVVIWVVCLIPIPETPLSDVNLIDKWTHFVMYGSLTTVIWFEYIRRHKQPLTRHYVTPSPQRARGEVSNETSKEGYAQEIVTSSSPLGERMPEGQVRGCNLFSYGKDKTEIHGHTTDGEQYGYWHHQSC